MTDNGEEPMTSVQKATKVWLTTKQVADRYQVVPRTIDRWEEDTTLNFPVALDINGRKYRSLEQLEQWERERLQSSQAGGNRGTSPKKQASEAPASGAAAGS
jgi:hypothetical protein